jgi:hypothetical protein
MRLADPLVDELNNEISTGKLTAQCSDEIARRYPLDTERTRAANADGNRSFLRPTSLKIKASHSSSRRSASTAPTHCRRILAEARA